jgi:hypothetical protein
MTRCIRYGQEVENYLEVYLKTPGLAREDITKALLARGNARKEGGEKLLDKAREGISALLVSLSNSDPMMWGRFSGRIEARPLK